MNPPGEGGWRQPYLSRHWRGVVGGVCDVGSGGSVDGTGGVGTGVVGGVGCCGTVDGGDADCTVGGMDGVDGVNVSVAGCGECGGECGEDHIMVGGGTPLSCHRIKAAPGGGAAAGHGGGAPLGQGVDMVDVSWEPPQCEVGRCFSAVCTHRRNVVVSIRCGKCGACMDRWRYMLGRRMLSAAERLVHAGYGLYFLTLTLEGYGETDELFERLAEQWSGWRRKTRFLRDVPWCRVFEIGNSTRRPHAHAILALPPGESLPEIRAIREGESVEEWIASLSPEAQALHARLVAAGWGRVMHLERAVSTFSVVTYLGGYLSDRRKVVYRDQRHRRLYGCSKSWPAPKPPVSMLSMTALTPADGQDPKDCPDCRTEHAGACTAELRDKLRDVRMRQWMAPLWGHPDLVPMVDALMEARARVRGRGVLCNDVWSREAAREERDKAMRVIRDAGYEGPVGALVWWYDRGKPPP